MAEILWIKRIPGYHYHDSPEGQDCLKKIIFVNKMGLFFGTITGTIDCFLISKPVGIWNILGRYAYSTGPICAVFSSWAAATCICTSLRGKDDPLNYLFGGFVAGSVFGAIVRDGKIGTLAAVLMGVFGHAKKESERFGVPLWSDTSVPPVRTSSSIWLRHYDFTYLEDKPRGWRKFEGEEV